MQKITPFLWFDNQAEEAVNFYTSLFKKSKIGSISRYNEASAKAAGVQKGLILTVTFELAGQNFAALNGGPIFKFTPAVSFYIDCETETEIDKLWERLAENATRIFWQLRKYPFSQKYGWLVDKFGVSWQMNLVNSALAISPFLSFFGKQYGKAEEAINFYISVFKNSGINLIARYSAEEEKIAGTIKHASFFISGQEFKAMESSKDHPTFNESISFVVNCETQEEVDYYWEKLSAVPESEQCGWLKDKYGVSWQIVPTILGQLMSDPDPVKSQNVTKAMLQMKKIEIAGLQRAYDGG